MAHQGLPQDLLPGFPSRLPDGPFALIRRGSEPDVELLTGGAFEQFPALADLPTEDSDALLALVPYRQLMERGDECHDDHTPLLALRIRERSRCLITELPPATPPVLRDGAFDVDDEAYGASVKRVLDEEIGAGEGSNFVLRRTFVGHCDSARETAYGAFRALLERERNAYWTFLIDTGEGLMVGATPERHVSLSRGIAVMNPISGTLREPPATASRERVVAFLGDAKERDELAMVVDEELKMLAEVGDLGGRVRGPFLKEMTNLAHTEYYIEARTTMDPRLILRTTMFAPTATGSPIRNAFRVIKRHERGGRGYYAGVAALISHDETGAPEMDAPLMLRVAYVANDGTVRVPVGATLVRGSDPYEEVRETYAKAAGVLRAFGVAFGPTSPAHTSPGTPAEARTAPWSEDPEIAALLAARNETLSPFWLNEHEPANLVDPALAGRRVLIIDNEDAFTSMLAVELRSLGLETTRVAHDEVPDHSAYDLVLLGPGPGDPRDLTSPRINGVRKLAKLLIDHRTPTLGLCLGHQALAAELGLELVRLPTPMQGMQAELDLFGSRERVAFYNSYAARLPEFLVLETVAIPDSSLTAALRGPSFTGLQFHPESVLTMDGLGILGREIRRLLSR
ncbi:chorismate-binding protein [Catenulispora sp. NF23]|uniref:anthranilate synthase n=1 Tax=Catenulispora pinistramenti TaxID=2705254 RepID=A0ABS5L8C1_9ACTN|nr:chorismate-binding protein [Catenulispora pinistramenti]MBS2539917.1 chorismate-binding protein [Catenulispora pinistramenti]MBS2554581.1 chorismate-binding protein [Catenulispora pinistramenti]